MAPNWPRLILPLAALTGAAGASAAVSVAVTAPQATTLCLEGPPPATDGRRRAVLVVFALTGGTLSVTADNGETSQIGLFPAGAFDSGEDGEPRRFFLPGDTNVTCWDVAPEQGQSARLSLELSEPLE